jgi:hypothetical protein
LEERFPLSLYCRGVRRRLLGACETGVGAKRGGAEERGLEGGMLPRHPRTASSEGGKAGVRARRAAIRSAAYLFKFLGVLLLRPGPLSGVAPSSRGSPLRLLLSRFLLRLLASSSGCPPGVRASFFIATWLSSRSRFFFSSLSFHSHHSAPNTSPHPRTIPLRVTLSFFVRSSPVLPRVHALSRSVTYCLLSLFSVGGVAISTGTKNPSVIDRGGSGQMCFAPFANHSRASISRKGNADSTSPRVRRGTLFTLAGAFCRPPPTCKRNSREGRCDARDTVGLAVARRRQAIMLTLRRFLSNT